MGTESIVKLFGEFLKEYTNLDKAVDNILTGSPERRALASFALHIAEMASPNSSDDQRMTSRALARKCLPRLRELNKSFVSSTSMDFPVCESLWLSLASATCYTTLGESKQGLEGTFIALLFGDQFCLAMSEAISLEKVMILFCAYYHLVNLTLLTRNDDFRDLMWEGSGDFNLLSLWCEIIGHWPDLIEKHLTIVESLVDRFEAFCAKDKGVAPVAQLWDQLCILMSLCSRMATQRNKEVYLESPPLSSPYHWALRLGQSVGRLHSINTDEFIQDIAPWPSQNTLVSLLLECLLGTNDGCDWGTFEGWSSTMWQRTVDDYGYETHAPGPNSGLYWASRVGLAQEIQSKQMPTAKFVKVMNKPALKDLDTILASSDEIEKNPKKSIEEYVVRETNEREQAEKFLSQLLGSDSLSILQEDSVNLLVNVQTSYRTRNWVGCIENIRIAIGIELVSLLPVLSECHNKEVNNGHLVTRCIAKKLEGMEVIVSKLTIENEVKRWLVKDLPQFLNRLVHNRNIILKDTEKPATPQLRREIGQAEKNTENIYNEFLGIRNEGVLPRLVKIKQRNRS